MLMNGSGSVDADDALAEANAADLPEIAGQECVQLVIFKSNDDLRQEMFAMLLISIIRTAWIDDGLDLYLREYRVLSTSPSSGLVEVVPDSSSIDALKKSNGCLSLTQHFNNSFGAGSAAYERAVSAFINSLAGYSLLTYLLNIKDRHNGNILLQRDGHIVHIDFGFFFSIAPGGITFESAPFKMTRDFHELVGPNDLTNPRYC
jgi:phosphatidylinositol 4-kinase